MKWWGVGIAFLFVAVLGGVVGYVIHPSPPVPGTVQIDTVTVYKTEVDTIVIKKYYSILDTVFRTDTVEIAVAIKDSSYETDYKFQAKYFEYGMIAKSKQPIVLLKKPEGYYKYNSEFSNLLADQWRIGVDYGKSNCSTSLYVRIKYFGIGFGTGLALYGISQMF